ncbi:hypothetical protein Vadar_002538 [Vaccinium darrowii]|uniref:Uncharacterized protein n=1 Tax=Vaccinium darrowii TaxID=229202 RepID=A0ACB7XFD2_9ERIC|nr:hypothetical protein Vadar_002538 [Vaccinium darrowii]
MPPPMTPMLLAAPNWGAEKEVEEEATAEPMSKDVKGMALGFEEEREGWNGAEVEEEAAAEPMSKDVKGMALGFEEEREGWNGAVGRRRF